MRRWILLLCLTCLVTPFSLAAAEPPESLQAGQDAEIRRWAATLPPAWRGLDWVSIIDDVATPHPEVGGRVSSMLAWLPKLLEDVRIPGPNDPPVIVFMPSCQCSGGVLEVALVTQDGRVERLPFLGGVASVRFTDGALAIRAGHELDTDANCCPSVVEQRTLRWVDNAAVWRTDYLPGQLPVAQGCWHAGRLVDADNARWVDTSGVGISRSELQKRLFACGDDPEQEARRVSQLGKGLRIALVDGVIQIAWNAAAQRWDVKDESRRDDVFNIHGYPYLRSVDDFPLRCEVVDAERTYHVHLDRTGPRMAVEIPAPLKATFEELFPNEGLRALLLRLEDAESTAEGGFTARTDDLGDPATVRFDAKESRLELRVEGDRTLSGECTPKP